MSAAGTNGTPAVAISGLRKTFPVGFLHRRRRLALAGLDLRVERGEIFGYLGPNGSGKTTTLKLLLGLLHADAGSATILGADWRDRSWRFRTGYQPENPYLYDYLTAREYLRYVGRLFGMARPERRRRADELLDRVGMAYAADWPMRRYSKGMLQRVGLAQALVNKPELVILDEPMSGLDPIGRRMVRDLILELRRDGGTVLFSTHILSDAESLCDRVALLREGKVVEVGALSEILRVDVSHLEVLAAGLGEPEAARLPASVKSRSRVGDRWRLEVAQGSLAEVVRAVEQDGGTILSVSPVRQSLEEVFFREIAPEEHKAWIPGD
jgi:ABC-2 type transport system ATP-binding protein